MFWVLSCVVFTMLLLTSFDPLYVVQAMLMYLSGSVITAMAWRVK